MREGWVEPELLGLDIEVEIGEGSCVAVEEGGRRSADDAVERRHPLLPVQEQPDDARCKLLLAAVGRPSAAVAHTSRLPTG